jgi:antitoxin ParD1/3/4
MPRNTSITLGEHFDNYVQEKIQQGRFLSVSEVVRAGLRKLEEDDLKLKVLRTKLQAGEDSPIVEDFDEEQFLASMHKKYNQWQPAIVFGNWRRMILNKSDCIHIANGAPNKPTNTYMPYSPVLLGMPNTLDSARTAKTLNQVIFVFQKADIWSFT